MPRTPLLAALAGLLVAGPDLQAQTDREQWLDSCRRNSSSRGVRHCEIRDLTMPAVGRLDVNAGRNGGMSIRAGDVDRVIIEARVQARGSTAAEAAALAGGVGIVANDGLIRVIDPAGEGSATVVFVITTPKRVDVHARADNGPLGLTGLEGRIDAEVTNGPLALRDLSGEVRARALNGPLSVRLSGTRWNGRGLDASAENGPIVLHLPENYSADLTAGTTHGPLISDLSGSRVITRGNQRLIETRLGSGGPPIKVVSTNGPAAIRVGERRRELRM